MAYFSLQREIAKDGEDAMIPYQVGADQVLDQMNAEMQRSLSLQTSGDV
jgi:hypothetical protein